MERQGPGCQEAAVELRPEKRPDVMQGPGGSSRCRGLAKIMLALPQQGHSCGRQDGGWAFESYITVGFGDFFIFIMCVSV